MHVTKLLKIITVIFILFAATSTMLLLFQEPEPGVKAVDMNLHTSSNQTNILLLIVDRIDKSEPELLSAWLVLKLSTSSQLTFLPLFPQDDGNWERGKKYDSFSINLEQELPVPDRQILEKLNASDLYWGDYIVTDLEAIAGFVDLLDGVFINSQLTPGSQVYSGEILKEISPASSIFTQANIITEICRGIPLFSLHPDLESTIFNFLTHSISSINVTGITRFIQSTSTKDFNPKCEFPTLVSENG